MLLNRIQGLYSLRDSMHRQDQHCFRITLQEWKTQPIPEMKKWLHLHTEHIRHCMKQEKLRLRQKIPDIRTWFKAKSKDDTQTQPQRDVSKTQHKQRTQKLLHRFFNKAPTCTDTKLAAQK